MDRSRYYKEWAKANLERRRKTQSAYYQRHRERCRRAEKRYVEKNRERVNALARRPGRRAKSLAWRKANPDRMALYNLKRRLKRFGLTVEQYHAMVTAQNTRCAICQSESTKNAASPFFRIDHCHATNTFRGLICDRCNIGLGAFQDRPSVMFAAAQYLLRHQDVSEVL